MPPKFLIEAFKSKMQKTFKQYLNTLYKAIKFLINNIYYIFYL